MSPLAGWPASDLLAAVTGWAVFGVFVALCVVLAVFVIRFARQQHRRGRDAGPPTRGGRRRDGTP